MLLPHILMLLITIQTGPHSFESHVTSNVIEVANPSECRANGEALANEIRSEIVEVKVICRQVAQP